MAKTLESKSAHTQNWIIDVSSSNFVKHRLVSIYKRLDNWRGNNIKNLSRWKRRNNLKL